MQCLYNGLLLSALFRSIFLTFGLVILEAKTRSAFLKENGSAGNNIPYNDVMVQHASPKSYLVDHIQVPCFFFFYLPINKNRKREN